MDKEFLSIPPTCIKKLSNCSSPIAYDLLDSAKHDETPLTCSTIRSQKNFQNISAFESPKHLSKTSSCKHKLEVLSLQNQNIKLRYENESLKFSITQTEQKMQGIKAKILKLNEESKQKDTMFAKITDSLMIRENQFATIFETEQIEYQKIIQSKNHEIALMKKKQPHINTVNKAIQIDIDNQFNEELLQRDQEIKRLQTVLQASEATYSKEKTYLEENILVLEEELEKSHNLLGLPEESDRISPHIEEITKICNEISIIKDESVALALTKSDNFDFIDTYLSQTSLIPLAHLHSYLTKALHDLSSLKSSLKLLT